MINVTQYFNEEKNKVRGRNIFLQRDMATLLRNDTLRLNIIQLICMKISGVWLFTNSSYGDIKKMHPVINFTLNCNDFRVQLMCVFCSSCKTRYLSVPLRKYFRWDLCSSNCKTVYAGGNNYLPIVTPSSNVEQIISTDQLRKHINALVLQILRSQPKFNLSKGDGIWLMHIVRWKT